MKKTIFFLIDSLGVFGGAEKNLLTITSSLDKDKYRIIVACLQGGVVCQEFERCGIELIDLKIKRIYDFNAFLKAIKLVKLLAREKVRIVVTYLESSDFWGCIVAKLAGVPVIISNRRDLGFNLKSRHVSGYRFINNFFDKIIAVCEAVKLSIVNREKVSPDKIVTIFNGIEENKDLTFNPAELRISLGLDINKKIVTMVANLDPIKRHKDFLISAAKVLKQYKAVQFLLIGRGKSEYEQRLRGLSEELGIRDNVLFAGFRRDVAQILSISDISVLTSTSEGCSNTILESMSVGIPVIATNVGGNPEVVKNGETGLLIPAQDTEALANSILRLLQDKKSSEQMGRAGKSRIEELFRINRMIQETEDLFEALLIAKERKAKSRFAVVAKNYLLGMAKLCLANLMFYTGLIYLIRKISAQKHGLTILAYHRVGSGDYFGPSGMSETVESFEGQMRYLKNNYNPISLEQAIDLMKIKNKLPDNSVAITFDDGYKDNYTNAYPILKKYNIPATIFLTVGAIEENGAIWFDIIANAFRETKQKFIDLSKFHLNKYSLLSVGNKLVATNETISYAKNLKKDERDSFVDYVLHELRVAASDIAGKEELLSWDEIKQMSEEGITFGNHGMSHTILTNIQEDKLIDEIVISKNIVKDRSGILTKLFAYPNGKTEDYNQNIGQILEKNNYDAGFTLVKGYNNGTSNMFALKRLCISRYSSNDLFNHFSAALFNMEILGCFRLFKDLFKSRDYLYA